VLPFEAESFDLVTAITVLCFAREPERAVAEMARILRPGGKLLIGELGKISPWALWRRLRGSFGHATWRRARFRTAAELRGLATRAGLDVRSVRAAVFYPPCGAAALFAPLDRWFGRWIVTGGAFLVLLATKPASRSVDEDTEP
jgi:SAM-dependent methyltransferase